jgi:ribosome-binding factor A
MARGSKHARRGDEGAGRPYSRMARVNELCHQIVAEELERLDDDRLDLVTVTHVSIDRDLRRGIVEITALGGDDAASVEVLEEHRVRLQSAIARQARLRRTPELHFRPDVSLRTGERVDEILRTVTPDEPAGPGEGTR